MESTSSTVSEPTAGQAQRPQTGDEFLESLRDGREVWIYGERITDVTQHPAYRNSARSLASLYDAFDDPQYRDSLLVPTDTGSGGMTHAFFRASRSKDDLRAGRDATETWQRLGFGWLGRTPDYKAALITGFGTNPEWFGDFADNARHWYRRTQEEVLHIGHAIEHPPVDRSKGPEQVRDVFVHVDRETDRGLVISGAKVVATGSPLTQYIYVSHFGVPVQDKTFSVVFLAPTNAPEVKLLSRTSYEEVAARTSAAALRRRRDHAGGGDGDLPRREPRARPPRWSHDGAPRAHRVEHRSGADRDRDRRPGRRRHDGRRPGVGDTRLRAPDRTGVLSHDPHVRSHSAPTGSRLGSGCGGVVRAHSEPPFRWQSAQFALIYRGIKVKPRGD